MAAIKIEERVEVLMDSVIYRYILLGFKIEI